MSIYTALQTRFQNNAPAQREIPVYGAARLGVYSLNSVSELPGSTTSYRYELTDHLGNVRAVIGKTFGGTPYVVSRTDYYPFGMAMPNRNVEGSYRYKYQGQEKDSETGMEAFELRLWDSRIGRWLTTDPYGQFASPYLGMGNNPIIMIDPDGGKIIVTQNISGKDFSYEYRNGKFYDVNTGKLANPTTDFFNAIKDALSTIESSGVVGKNLIDIMVNESVEYEISFLLGSHHAIGSKVNIDHVAASQVMMAVEDLRNPFQIAPLYIVLAHELGHVFLNNSPSLFLERGIYAGPWRYGRRNRPITVGGRGLSKTELFASEIENAIRSESGLPQREFYSYEVDEQSRKPISPIRSTFLLDSAFFNLPGFLFLRWDDNDRGCGCR